MIKLNNVSKLFGDIQAVDNISFHIKKGEIVGFLGQNGAGKSTTMNMITGYISSSSGVITIDGKDILQHPEQAKQMIGYLPEQPPLYMDMTVSEYLQFACELKRVKKKKIKPQIAEALETAKITHVKHRIIANLSKGYKQRVGLAQTLCGNPKILILDEPTVGLDPNQIVEIRETIKQLGKTHTVILSSHILYDVADVCDRIIIIDKGRVIVDDNIEHLLGSSTDMELLIRIRGDKEKVLAALNSIPNCDVSYLKACEDDCNDYILKSLATDNLRSDILKVLIQENLPLLMLKPINDTLEDIFLKLTNEDKEV
jgi:ABC-2 type transport system ATP-binding protein